MSAKKPNDDPIRARKLKAGEVLFHEGDTSQSVFIITSGRLRVFKNGPEGRAHLADLTEKQIVGEMALLAKKPRSATIEAAEETVVLELDSNQLQKYFDGQPDWFKALIESLVMRIRSSNERIEKLFHTLGKNP